MMDLKSRWNEFFVLSERSSIVGIVIFGFVLLSRRVRSYTPLRQFLILNHERIHVRQWVETGFVLFAVWYPLEYLLRRLQYSSWDEAYRNISFEREAYDHEAEESYLGRRKFWSFINYL